MSADEPPICAVTNCFEPVVAVDRGVPPVNDIGLCAEHEEHAWASVEAQLDAAAARAVAGGEPPKGAAVDVTLECRSVADLIRWCHEQGVDPIAVQLTQETWLRYFPRGGSL